MEFAFDGGLAELRERGLDTGRTLVAPSAPARDARAGWDPDLFTTLGAAGVLGVALPTEHGGRGATPLEAVALLEGFGEGGDDAGLALSATIHGVLFGVPIATLGSRSQRDRHLSHVVSGERVGAVASSETGDEIVALRTAHGWRLDGGKHTVANAPVAHHFLVTAISGDGSRTAFLLDRDTPGLAVRPVDEPAVLRTCPVGELVLTGCEVGDDAVLGKPGRATEELIPLLAALDRTCLAAPWLGLLRGLGGRAVRLAAERTGFGAPLARSQSVRLAVVDVRTRTELAADLLYRAAWELGSGGGTPRRDPAMAKLFLTEALLSATGVAAGLAPDDVIVRLHRDSVAFAASAGGTDVLRAVIAESLLGAN
ncbi:acyl-CoA dehydrogenase family protein [Saccharothrix deserti]|uniref:acyl-CoA dehydrogenase family protein n=1 Tax=Saccharothrix deserti TaxID=2593674 RepID=UPI00131CBB5E|nr:acyl-CoA dehydrogenase family protein [Saccharothrix deserti]